MFGRFGLGRPLETRTSKISEHVSPDGRQKQKKTNPRLIRPTRVPAASTTSTRVSVVRDGRQRLRRRRRGVFLTLPPLRRHNTRKPYTYIIRTRRLLRTLNFPPPSVKSVGSAASAVATGSAAQSSRSVAPCAGGAVSRRR